MQRNGNGTRQINSKLLYTGEVEEGRPHGQGTATNHDGTKVYEGSWLQGEWHGRGIKFNFPSQHTVECMWAGTSRRGEGPVRMTFPDARLVYTGEMREARTYKQDGLGIMWRKHRISQCGQWESGSLIESRPVPISVLTFSQELNDRGQANGGRMRGEGMRYAC